MLLWCCGRGVSEQWLLLSHFWPVDLRPAIRASPSDHNTTESTVLRQYLDYFRQLRLGVADIARLEQHVKEGLRARKPLALIKQEIEVKLRFIGQNVRI